MASRPSGAPVAAGALFMRLPARWIIVALVVAFWLASGWRASDARAAAPGLVAAYAFDEGRGSTAADHTGNHHAATMTDVPWTTGKYGRAVLFNGTSSLARIADAADLHLSKGVTLEAYVCPNRTSDSQTLISKTRRDGGFPYGLELASGRPGGFVRIGGRTIRADSSSALGNGAWTFVALTYNGTVVRVYRSGTKVAETSASGSLSASTGALEIGGNSIWGEFFEGAIDNVRIYSRALSASELASDRALDVAKDAASSSPSPSPVPLPGSPPVTVAHANPDPRHQQERRGDVLRRVRQRSARLPGDRSPGHPRPGWRHRYIRGSVDIRVPGGHRRLPVGHNHLRPQRSEILHPRR